MRLNKKGDAEWDIPSMIAIGIIAAVVIILGILIFKGKLSSAVSYLRDWLRFG